MCVIIALCRCYYRSFELHLAGVCVCMFTVGKVFVGYPAAITERRSNVARVFALRKYDFQNVCACRRLRFHIHCFFFIHTAGSRYVLRFCISGLICTRVVVFRWIGLWNYFYKRWKQKDVVVQQSKADRLPFASQRTHIYSHIFIYYVYIRREAFNYWPLAALAKVCVWRRSFVLLLL